MNRISYGMQFSVILVLFTALASCAGGVISDGRSNGQNKCTPFDVLEKQVLDIDVSGIHNALHSLQCYDGGNLEDVYRALGIAFVKSPRLTMDMIVKADLKNQQLNSVFTMLPLSFVDDPCGSTNELIRRKALIEQTATTHKEQLLGAIDKSLARDKAHCSQTAK